MCLMAACLLAGCGMYIEPVELENPGVSPSADVSPLAAVLKEAIDAQGLLLPEALKRRQGDLDGQLAIFAVTGPTASPQLFPTPNHRLAYWYNASAAWSMKLALLADFPEQMCDREMQYRAFPLDGRIMTLEQIHEILSQSEDFRQPLLQPSVCFQGGHLPLKPFTAQDMPTRLDEGFNQYVADTRRLVIDIDSRCILYPPAMWRLRAQLVSRYNQRYDTHQARLATALMPHLRGAALRRLQDATGYQESAAARSNFLALPEKFLSLRKLLQ